MLVALDFDIGLIEVGHVLAQKREHRAYAHRFELDGCPERAAEVFARHETPYRTTREAPPWHMRREPLVLGAPEEEPSHRLPTLVQAGKSMRAPTWAPSRPLPTPYQ